MPSGFWIWPIISRWYLEPSEASLEPLKEDRLAVRLPIEYGGGVPSRVYDYVILATGSDQLTFLRGLLSRGGEEAILQRAGISEFSQSAVENRIDEQLAVEGMFPRLHLPMLSGMRQGPGFSNLSCLGRLSDRILSAYVARPEGVKA